MAIVDISLDNFRGNIPYRTEKLTWTPKMPFTKMSTQPRMLAKKFVGAATFKQLKSFRNTQGRSYLHKHMDMIWFNLKFVNFHVPLLCNFSKKLLTMIPNDLKLKWIHCIFRLPHQVVRVLTDTVSVIVKSFHFMLPPRFFYGANANTLVGERASYAARSSTYFGLRNSLWREGQPSD